MLKNESIEPPLEELNEKNSHTHLHRLAVHIKKAYRLEQIDNILNLRSIHQQHRKSFEPPIKTSSKKSFGNCRAMVRRLCDVFLKGQTEDWFFSFVAGLVARFGLSSLCLGTVPNYGAFLVSVCLGILWLLKLILQAPPEPLAPLATQPPGSGGGEVAVVVVVVVV